jgi:hypothetical protein
MLFTKSSFTKVMESFFPFLEPQPWIKHSSIAWWISNWDYLWLSLICKKVQKQYSGSISICYKNFNKHHNYLPKKCLYYCKMWVKFTSPHSLDQWIHCVPTRSYSLWPMNSLKIQWNYLVYMETFYWQSKGLPHNPQYALDIYKFISNSNPTWLQTWIY